MEKQSISASSYSFLECTKGWYSVLEVLQVRWSTDRYFLSKHF